MQQRMAAYVWVLSFSLLAGACSGPEGVTKLDRSGPFVVSTSPEDGAKNVDVETDVEVQFNEAILVVKKYSETKIETFDYSAFAVVDDKDAPVKGFLTFNNDVVRFKAAAPLRYATKYTVRTTNGVKDLFGNRGKANAFSFTTLPDTIAPSAPWSLVYPTLTKTISVQVSGSKDPGSRVRVNGADTGVAAAASDFSVTLSLSEGNNDFSFTAFDDAGNESGPSSIAITLDRVAPVGLTTCPDSNADLLTGLQYHDGLNTGCWDPPNPLYWNNRNLVLAAEWAPGAGESATFSIGESSSDSFTAPQFVFSQFRPALFAGLSVQLRAQASDQAGNVTTSFVRTFLFDEVAGLSAGNGAAALVTTATSLSLTFVKEAPAQFFATIDNQRAGSCAETDTECTVTLAGLTDGAHLFAATATDAAGNETRIIKTITVDTRPPTAVALPLEGGTAPLNPTLHVFADEPFTPLSAFVDGTNALTPVSDAASGAAHWSFSPGVPLADGVQHTAVITLRDAAGNSAPLSWSFTASSGYATTSTGATYSTPGVVGNARDGVFTVSGMAAGVLNVVRYARGGAPSVLAYAVTTATAVTATSDALSLLLGEVRAYDNEGTYTTAALPAFNPFYPGAPALAGVFVPEQSVSYSSIGFFDAPASGWAWLTDTGLAATVDGGAPQSVRISTCQAGSLLQLEPPWALLGCADTGVRLINLTASALAGYASSSLPNQLWSPANESSFGAAVTGARFFGDGNLQIAVGSPLGAGSLFVYAATTATAPTFVLHGDTWNQLAKFGSAAAFASAYFPGKRTLAVMAPKEPAIYFFDDAIYANQLAGPTVVYRGRWQWPPASCLVGIVRYELIAAGDLDGDGSQDFAATKFCDGASPNPMTLAVFYGGDGAAAGGPVLQTVSLALPTVDVAAFRPRLIAAGDLDGDGRADLAVADRTGGAAVRVFYGTPNRLLRQSLVTPAVVDPWVTWLLGGAMDGGGDGRRLILGQSDPTPLTGQLTLRTLP